MVGAGVTRKFYCDNCQDFTEHVSITQSEYDDSMTEGYNPIVKTIIKVGSIASDLTSDLTPLGKLIEVPFVCTECRTVTQRKV